MEGRAGNFLVTEKIQTAGCALGKKSALLERFFDAWPDNFLDRQITGIGSYWESKTCEVNKICRKNCLDKWVHHNLLKPLIGYPAVRLFRQDSAIEC